MGTFGDNSSMYNAEMTILEAETLWLRHSGQRADRVPPWPRAAPICISRRTGWSVSTNGWRPNWFRSHASDSII